MFTTGPGTGKRALSVLAAVAVLFNPHHPMRPHIEKSFPNLIRGRTLWAGVIFCLFGKDLGFLIELWTIFSDGLERNLASFWEVRLT